MADVTYIPEGNNQANNILPWMLASQNGFGGLGGNGLLPGLCSASVRLSDLFCLDGAAGGFDDLGDIITPSWSFTNDCEGFFLFKQLLDNFEGEKKIGIESTGHYGQNLKLFLESNGFTFMVFGSGGNSHPAPEKLNQY